jgi:hypothetical protein
MRARKIASIGVAATGALVLFAAAFWPSRRPVDVKLVRMERSGMIDDDGTEPWLVALSISNRSGGVLTLAEETVGVEACVNSLWVGAKPVGTVSNLRRGSQSELLVLVPFRAGSCRLRIRYLPEPLKLRFTRTLANLGMWRHSWSRALARRLFPVGWLEPLRSDYVGRSPRWKVVTPEVPLDPRTAGHPGSFSRAHNERSGVDAGWASRFSFLHLWPGATHRGCSPNLEPHA